MKKHKIKKLIKTLIGMILLNLGIVAFIIYAICNCSIIYR